MADHSCLLLSDGPRMRGVIVSIRQALADACGRQELAQTAARARLGEALAAAAALARLDGCPGRTILSLRAGVRQLHAEADLGPDGVIEVRGLCDLEDDAESAAWNDALLSLGSRPASGRDRQSHCAVTGDDLASLLDCAFAAQGRPARIGLACDGSHASAWLVEAPGLPACALRSARRLLVEDPPATGEWRKGQPAPLRFSCGCDLQQVLAMVGRPAGLVRCEACGARLRVGPERDAA